MTKTDTVSTITPTVTGDDIADMDVIAASDKGARMKLLHPTTDDVLMIGEDEQYIDVLGKDSRLYKEIMSEIQARQFTRAARKKNVGAALRGIQNEVDSLELLAKLCTGWRIWIDGQSPKFTEGAAKQVLGDYPWIYEQVDEFIGNRANFL